MKKTYTFRVYLDFNLKWKKKNMFHADKSVASSFEIWYLAISDSWFIQTLEMNISDYFTLLYGLCEFEQARHYLQRRCLRALWCFSKKPSLTSRRLFLSDLDLQAGSHRAFLLRWRLRAAGLEEHQLSPCDGQLRRLERRSAHLQR